MFKKYITHAFRGVRSARSRAASAIAGVAMGIFLVTALLFVGSGVTAQITEQISSIGSDILVVNATPAGSSGDGASFVGLSEPTLTLDDIESVRTEPTVSTLAPIRYLGGEITYDGVTTTPTFIAATTHEYAVVRNITMESGRFPTEEDESSLIPRVAIGTATEKALFPSTDPLGKTLLYGDMELVVVGVMSEQSSGADSIAANNIDNAVYGTSSIISDVGQRSFYNIVMAKVDPVSAVSTAKENIQSTLATYKEAGTYSVRTEEDRNNTSQTILTLLKSFVVVIGVISLVISGIVVMNSMVISVTDRTREIGVRKTVGATSASIFAQFLLEAIILTVVGGVIGLLGSIAAMYIVAAIAPIEPIISPGIIILGVGLSTTTGIIFGVGPALVAARKDAIDSLQTDYT